MPTPYSEIFDVFMSQYNDEVFNTLDNDDSLKLRYLKNAIPRFKRCKQNLTDRNDATTFNITLTEEEILILGTLMVIEYIKPMMLNLKLIKQAMTNREFQMTSQANHLKQLLELKTTIEKDVRGLIRDYTYNNSDLGELK